MVGTGAGGRGGAGARGRAGAGAGGRGGARARGRVGVGASEASAETVAPTFDHTRRGRSERRDGSAHGGAENLTGVASRGCRTLPLCPSEASDLGVYKMTMIIVLFRSFSTFRRDRINVMAVVFFFFFSPAYFGVPPSHHPRPSTPKILARKGPLFQPSFPPSSNIYLFIYK